MTTAYVASSYIEATDKEIDNTTKEGATISLWKYWAFLIYCKGKLVESGINLRVKISRKFQLVGLGGR